ncbi:hypothetical protein LDENG_00184270 [Lucifuga dentata]|nr:hypothetical protein LDENG_00184270 [Lucifuga dentata]
MDESILQRAAEEKVNCYQPVTYQIGEMLGMPKVKVLGFQVGAQGKWPSTNKQVLSELGLTASQKESFGRLIS